MSRFTLLVAGLSTVLSCAIVSCSTVEESGSNVVSHDAERQERLDSLSAVHVDSVVQEKKLGQATLKPATTKDKK